jgi:heme oxygenase
LHSHAERIGIVAAILTGTVTQSGYATCLRNLLPAYREMEQALPGPGAVPGLGYLNWSSLHRAGRIEMDLGILAGPGWPVTLPLLSAGQRYADRVRQVAADNVELLLAHACTRYLTPSFRLFRKSLAAHPTFAPPLIRRASISGLRPP